MKHVVIRYQNILAILLLIVLTIPVLLPFLSPGFFTSHDGEWTVVRLADMFRTLRDGQFPARYSGYLNMQYGYPLFNFAYPFPYYLGIPFVLLKAGFVTTIKLLFIIWTLSSVFGMYLLSKTLWKSTTAGVLSAVLFLYLPYRMVDLYVRGSLGEVTALGIIPFLFLSMYLTITKRSYLFTALSGILLGFLLPSHNIMSLLFTPILLVFSALLLYQQKFSAVKYVVTAFLLGIGLSAYFVIPALLEKQNILLSTIPIADRSLYFVSLKQLIFPGWGYGVPTDATNPFTYQIGMAQLLSCVMSVMAVVLAFRARAQKLPGSTVLAGALLVLTGILVVMVFPVTNVIWELTPLLSEINYPWTLIAPIGFLLSLIAGFAAAQKRYLYPSIILIVMAVVTVLPYAKPEKSVDRGDDYYLTNMATTTSSQEYTPLWVKKLPVTAPSAKVEATGSATSEHIVSSSKRTTFEITAEASVPVTINTIYYPGWRVSIDGQETAISYANPQGVMQIRVPEGKHRVEAIFTETPLRQFSNILTLMSFVALSALLIFGIYRLRS